MAEIAILLLDLAVVHMSGHLHRTIAQVARWGEWFSAVTSTVLTQSNGGVSKLLLYSVQHINKCAVSVFVFPVKHNGNLNRRNISAFPEKLVFV